MNAKKRDTPKWMQKEGDKARRRGVVFVKSGIPCLGSAPLADEWWKLSERTPGMGRWPLDAGEGLPRYGRTETAGGVLQLKPDSEFPKYN